MSVHFGRADAFRDGFKGPIIHGKYRTAYNGPLVKTSNEDLKVNIRSKACPVIIVAGNQRRHEKLIRESPLTMGLGRLGRMPGQSSAASGWPIDLKTAPRGPIVKGTVD